MSSNGVDKIIIDGPTVNVHEMEAGKELTAETFSKPMVAMKFQREVSKVRFNGSKWVVGVSGDEHLGLFNSETQKTIMCKPGHEGCSVKSGQVDPTGTYVASTGTDGHLNIYKFTGDGVEFLTKVKVSDKKVSAERTYDLEFQWL